MRSARARAHKGWTTTTAADRPPCMPLELVGLVQLTAEGADRANAAKRLRSARVGFAKCAEHLAVLLLGPMDVDT